MKKLFGLLLVLVLALGLFAACGSADDEKDTPSSTEAPATSTPVVTATPAATSTPTPTNTPEPETPSLGHVPDNAFVWADFDQQSGGTLITGTDFGTTEPQFTYMFFSGMGAASSSFSEGTGVDGSNCMAVTGRSDAWNGLQLTIPTEFFGKSLKVSFDGYCETEDLTEVVISLTSKFYVEIDGSYSAQYPANNRVEVTTASGEWGHGEGTIYFPTDIYVDPNDGNYACIIYWEVPGTKADFSLDNIVITLEEEGIGTFEDLQAKE